MIQTVRWLYKLPPDSLPNSLDALVSTLGYVFVRVISSVVLEKYVVAETVDDRWIVEQW